MQGHSKSCLLEVTIQWCQAWEGQPSFTTGTFFSKKAHSPREEGALGIGLATAASLCLSQLLAWREWPCSPEWSCHKQWEPLGTFWHTAWLCMASPISQAFPASSHISGNFLIERTGRQPHFSASYSCLLCITAITLKKKNSGLYGRTEQFKT